jgi:hypothetical protein
MTEIAAAYDGWAEVLNGAVQAGFDLRDMGEWRDPESSRTALPRLLSAHFRLQ